MKNVRTLGKAYATLGLLFLAFLLLPQYRTVRSSSAVRLNTIAGLGTASGRFVELFDELNLGDLTGQNGWTAFNSDGAPFNNAQVEDSIVHSGTRALSTPPNNGVTSSHVIDNLTAYTATAWFQFSDSIPCLSEDLLRLVNNSEVAGNGSDIFRVGTRNCGDRATIANFSSGDCHECGLPNGDTIAAREWHSFTIEVRSPDGFGRAKLDDNDFSDWHPPLNGGGPLRAVRLSHRDDDSNTIYFDDLTVMPGPVLAATVQPPINPNGSSVYNSNRGGVVPVKFRLESDGVPTCSLPPATISVTRTSGAAPGTVNQQDYITPADNGSTFRIVDCQYLYNSATGLLGPGTYRIDIKIDGTAVGTATFQLK